MSPSPISPVSAEEVVARLKQLPSLPSAVSELLASFNDDDVEIDAIARLIAKDQGLSARVLRVANSPFYGRQSKVSSIQEAVVVLGFRTVRSTVLAVGMTGAFRVEQCPGFDPAAYLRHGVGVALSARVMAPLVKVDPDQAFTAGLLHDIGQLVLASTFSTVYAQTIAYQREHNSLLQDAERAVMGIDHAQIGGLLALAWKFPGSLLEGVRDHHQPVSLDSKPTLADLIHISDGTAHALGLSNSPLERVSPIDDGAWSRLNLSDEQYQSALHTISNNFESTCQAFST